MLGRVHIQMLNLENFETKIIKSIGEDHAERIGEYMKQNPGDANS